MTLALPHSTTRLRTVVRPLARAVLRTPGRLYHPLYFLGVDRLEAIEADIQALAEAEGVPVTFLRNGGALPGSRTILVAPIEAAPGILDAHDAEVRQVILWGNLPAETLPEDVQAWLAQGLVIDPTTDTAHENEWSMGPTIARAARDRGRGDHPIVLLGPSATAPALTQEATLRLEAGGIQDVISALGPLEPDSRLLARLKAGSALVLHQSNVLTSPQALSLAEIVETLRARQVLLVVVGDERLSATIENTPRLAIAFAKGLTLVMGRSGANRAARDAARSRILDTVEWPSLDVALVGKPLVRQKAQRIVSGRLPREGDNGVNITLATALLWARKATGWLVCYTPTSVGVIMVEAGNIVATAWGAPDVPLDESYGDPAIRTLFDRMIQVLRWSGGRVSFIAPGVEAGNVSRLKKPIDLQTAIVELDRRSDEASLRHIGLDALAHMWQQVEIAISTVSPQAQAVWNLTAEPRTGEDLSLSAGLTREETINALDELLRAGAISDVGTESAKADLSDAEVARILDAMGLREEATTSLIEAEQAGVATGEGRFLRGIFVSEHDPQAADRAFRNVALDPVAAPRIRFDATLNATLMEVRGGQTDPSSGWRHVREQLSRLSSGLDASWTAEHALLAAEVALRAGDDAAVAQILQTLAGVSGDLAARRDALASVLKG